MEQWMIDFDEWFNRPNIQEFFKAESDFSTADSERNSARLAWFAAHELYSDNPYGE